MNKLLKGILASLLLAIGTSASADPIGPPTCGSCYGTTITLEYEVVTANEYLIHLFVDTTGFVGGGNTVLDNYWISQVAVKPASAITASSNLVASPGSAFTFVLGGLNSGGCNGSGSGFECATTNSITAVGTGSNGGTYEWIFDTFVSNSNAWLIAAGGASVKINFNGPNQPNGLLTSENITLQPFIPFLVPEPGTLALLGIGMLGAALARRRRQS